MDAFSPSEALARRIIHKLLTNGYQAFLVGGCVRDRLLNREPKDHDVSTSAPPQELVRLFPDAQTVGAHFGVVLVSAGAGVHVEVATFRSEDSYLDGRRPGLVHFETEPALDAQRRDFTINGLLQDMESGQVYDFVNGRADLDDKVIRAIGDPIRRFEEDHLRMLRAVRFAARLDFKIEPNTGAAIKELAPLINRISAERIRDEIVRMLTEGRARRAFELLDECGLLVHILPEVKAFQGVQQPPEFHPEGDVWQHVLLMLSELESPTPTLALGALLHDVGKPATFRVADRIRFDGHAEAGAEMTRHILERLRFSNEDTDHITALVANHMKFKDLLKMRLSTLKRFLSMPRFSEHLELHRLDCMASNGYTEAYRFAQQMLSEMATEELRPRPLITGRDLIAAGYQPGPLFSRALEAVHTAQLEGEICTADQALSIAKQILD